MDIKGILSDESINNCLNTYGLNKYFKFDESNKDFVEIKVDIKNDFSVGPIPTEIKINRLNENTCKVSVNSNESFEYTTDNNRLSESILNVLNDIIHDYMNY